jgi:hypothetical protein
MFLFFNSIQVKRKINEQEVLVEIINKSNLEYVFKLSNLFINNNSKKSKLKFLNIFCKIYHFHLRKLSFFVIEKKEQNFDTINFNNTLLFNRILLAMFPNRVNNALFF